jgi:hypothetical protein
VGAGSTTKKVRRIWSRLKRALRSLTTTLRKGVKSERLNSGGPRPKAFGIVIYSEDRPERGSFVDGGNL